MGLNCCFDTLNSNTKAHSNQNILAKVLYKMKINLKCLPIPSYTKIFLISLVSFLQFIIAGIFTLTISQDSKNAVIFSFSIQRLVLVFVSFALAGVILATGIIVYKRKITFVIISQLIQSNFVRILINGVIFLFIFWGLLSIYYPAYLFGKWASYYERVQPLSIALGLSAFEFWFLSITSKKKTDFQISFNFVKRIYFHPILAFAIGILSLGIFIVITKIGLVQDTAFWNVPGIPLSGFQIFSMVILIGLGIICCSRYIQYISFLQKFKIEKFIPLLIFLLAILVWGFTPMLKQYFSLEPIFPNYQPYPFDDARIHDLGGISILVGRGIYFHGYTDKPLYMVFLAVLHLLANYDYSLLTWLQILVLAFIPVTLFFFGKKFHSFAFGLFLSLIIIVRQQNAIILSYKIASVNPKLLLTEMMTFLGIILFTYLVFLWFRTKKPWLSVLSGGVIGAASLIRLNPLFLFPSIACLIIPIFWKSPKKILIHFSLYTLGFLILIIPWIITGVNPEGKPWILIKFIDVINVRYEQKINQNNFPIIDSVTPTVYSSDIQSGNISQILLISKFILPYQKESALGQKVLTGHIIPDSSLKIQKLSGNIITDLNFYLILNHFLHNISTSVLALPDYILYDDINQLSQREYWQDTNNWKGDFTAAQAGMVIFNLLLIAIGLGYSWRRYRWAGLAPLFVFLTYSLSLGFAMNSGGRYIVPIDWIIYFYYTLAIVLIINFISGFLYKKDNGDMKPPEIDNSRHFSDRKAFWFSLIGLLCLASLIPIANFVIPAISDFRSKQAEIDAVTTILSADVQENESLTFGEILYPYYGENGILEFNLLTDQDANEFSINEDKNLVKDLVSGDHVVLRSHIENGFKQVESIYLLENSLPVLIWKRLP